MSAPAAHTGASKLGLYPLLVKGSGDRYTVINRAGGQAISTSHAGVEAIRLLREGRTVRDAQRILSDRYGRPAGEVDLAPLIETLFSSGFVQTLDGRAVASRAGPGRQGFRWWLSLFVLSPLVGLAFRVLSPGLALRLAYRWFRSRSAPEVERSLVANLRRAPALDQAESHLTRIAVGSRQAVRKEMCDRLLLASAPPRRLRRWLQRVRVSGLEHLAGAGARRCGTVLCSFHLGSYGLIPFVLAARGIPVTAYAGFGDDARTDVTGWLREQARRGQAYPLRIVGGRMGLRTLVSRLQQGETVLLYCDQSPGAGHASPGRRDRIKVPFLGTSVWAARGAGWLGVKTGAAVLPVVLLWERGGHRLHIDPEVSVHQGRGVSDETDAVVLAVYERLERYVRQYPSQWLKWREFDGMVAG